jgi:hypothetical protein
MNILAKWLNGNVAIIHVANWRRGNNPRGKLPPQNILPRGGLPTWRNGEVGNIPRG